MENQFREVDWLDSPGKNGHFERWHYTQFKSILSSNPTLFTLPPPQSPYSSQPGAGNPKFLQQKMKLSLRWELMALTFPTHPVSRWYVFFFCKHTIWGQNIQLWNCFKGVLHRIKKQTKKTFQLSSCGWNRQDLTLVLACFHSTVFILT